MLKQDLIRAIWPHVNHDIPIIFEICKYGRADYRLEEWTSTGGYTVYYDGAPEARIYLKCFRKQFANPRELAARISGEVAEQKRIDGYFIDR